MVNLLKNAFKYTKNGQIEVKFFYDRTQVELIVHVKDSGEGIKQEDMPKLFTHFGKKQRTAALNNDGIGLGLMIVKSIVEASGGSIVAESKGIQGDGSLFIFSLKYASVFPDQMSRDRP